ncbi:MAG TPA: nucleoside hydrolase [Roseiflexaceae bacterium]|nr:nucleoside hydrolase [Roseiflexaceae bacterium]
MIPTIIDCDPGLDDVMALLLGARTLDLVGITVTHGNAPLAATTHNARQAVELAGITHIPLAAGMARPLLRAPHHALEIHGAGGLGGHTLPEPSVPLNSQHAVDFIIAQSHRVPGLHLAPIGPLTNIAAALLKDPTLPERIAQICLMGGSTTSGNTTAAAEFNIYADAEAAHIVFTSGIPIKMVGLNVTRQVTATPDRLAQVRAIGTRTARVAAGLLEFLGAQVRRFGLPGGAMHDPLAVAALVAPDVVAFEPMHVAVELRGEHTYGMTVCDARPSRSAPPNAEVAVAVCPERFWELFLETLATYP